MVDRDCDSCALELVPAETDAGDGGDNRLDDDGVHELPVHELLERQRPQRAQRLTVEAECVRARASCTTLKPPQYASTSNGS